MIRIAHLGAYGTNIGDTVAINNIRIQIQNYIDNEIQWIPINIIGFLNCKNNKQYVLNTFREKLEGVSALFIGGGGLLEGGPFNDTYTGWKLPFNEEIFKELDINIPIYIIGAGINYFRDVPEFTKKGVLGLISLIEKSSVFSLRNDGSMESAQKILPAEVFKKIVEVPDPGLIYDHQNDRIDISDMANKEKVLQPAFNGGQNIMLGRFLNNDNFNKIIELPLTLGLKILPHTPKDYMHFPLHDPNFSVVWRQDYFNNHSSIDSYKKLLHYYTRVGCSIAMRGHGQMIALALNVPSIYLSTQDKVLNFSKKNQLMDFNVDIKEQNWSDKLKRLFNDMTNDKSFLLHWYEIRDTLIKDFKLQFSSLCKTISQDISKENGKI